MGSSSTWSRRLAEVLATERASSPASSAGVRRVVLEGRAVAVKVGPAVADEAEGLRSLAAVAGGPPVPEVLVEGDGVLAVEWVDAGPRTEAGEAVLGQGLARLHTAPWSTWGGGSGWIGPCLVDPTEAPDAATFYGRRLTELARRCRLEAAVEPVVARLGSLVPSGPPALVHGDLWWGNVVWDADGRAWLIDPSAHGGHPEEDLAMLALFGPVPSRLLAAYQQVRPLEPGWQDRVALFQLYPLLVHTVLFGGHYRNQAEAAAARYR